MNAQPKSPDAIALDCCRCGASFTTTRAELEDYDRKSKVARCDRCDLEARFGEVWNTEELQKDYTVEGFGMGYCVVLRKSDGVRGSLDFQHAPRFYFGWVRA